MEEYLEAAGETPDDPGGHGAHGPRLAQAMRETHPEFVAAIRACVADRGRGGVVVEVPESFACDPKSLRLWYTGLAGALGEVMPEDEHTDGRPMPARWYVTIPLSGQAPTDPRLAHFGDARLPWPLHTDRALKPDPGDYLLVAKEHESPASGGQIRLLHIDDFRRVGEFLAHPLAFAPVVWKPDYRLAPGHAQSALRNQAGVSAPVFEESDAGPLVRFTDHRFRRPRSPELIAFLDDLASALAEEAEVVPEFTLPIGGAYVINNRFVLHGRRGFEAGGDFRRALLRFCGRWTTDDRRDPVREGVG